MGVRKKHLLYLTVLLVVLSVMLGTLLLSQVLAVTTATITFIPDSYTWGDPVPETWTAEIDIGRYTSGIVCDTILLEGELKPTSCKYPRWWWGGKYYAYFPGPSVKSILESKISHDGIEPGIYDVPLTITGKYKYRWYTYRDFEGTGYIKVIVPESMGE